MTETINLDYITKIEGHAKLQVILKKGKVEDVNLEVFEGARFFEGLVTGMPISRVPVVTSRICGVCSYAHMIASCMAIENAYNVKVTEQTIKLRKLLILASSIQSHVIHIFFMALPDYYGYDGAVTLAKKKPEMIKLALKIKQLVNDILIVVSGREIHAVTATLGGFEKLPKQEELDNLCKQLKEYEQEMLDEFLKIFPKLEKSDFETDCDFISLSGEFYANIVNENKDKILSLTGDEFVIEDYKEHLKEYIKEYSSAKFIKMHDKTIMTSSLARINHYHTRLSKKAKILLDAIGLSIPNKSPINNNLCQAVEIIHFYNACVAILESLKIVEERPVEVKVTGPAVGLAAVDVPRGILFHEYHINEKGNVTECNIITPTTQNISNIEKDLIEFLPHVLDRKKEKIVLFIEKVVRSYDPCISCSTHFLEIDWQEE
ncbi:MAG: Ni/Fe hydrogenase subunit alpha [Candidatus Woesearchaeota archaeon]|jgi:coenzyme F420-reducing hydrogenase alpha subunit